MLTRQPPTTTTSRLRPVSKILRRDEEYRPQFRNSQNIPLSPSISWVSIVMVLDSVGLTCEPTGKERRLRQLALFDKTHDRRTYDQTQQIVEHRDCLSNNPRKSPQHQPNNHPRSNRNKSALVHAVGSPEQTDVDVFACHMTIDHASDHNLCFYQRCMQLYSKARLTVGIAMP